MMRTSTHESGSAQSYQAQPQVHSGDMHLRSASSYDRIAPSPYATVPNPAYQSLPVAFLNLDLVVLKSNQAFQGLVGFLGVIRGKSLMDLLEPRSTDVLQRIRSELRDERDAREPTYMAPITASGLDPVQLVPETDVDDVSHGYTDRAFLLNFRLPNGQHQIGRAHV